MPLQHNPSTLAFGFLSTLFCPKVVELSITNRATTKRLASIMNSTVNRVYRIFTKGDTRKEQARCSKSFEAKEAPASGAPLLPMSMC